MSKVKIVSTFVFKNILFQIIIELFNGLCWEEP